MATESIPLPDLPPALRDFLAGFDPGVVLVVGRLGARHYERVVELSMHPDPDHTREQVSAAVVGSVDAAGDGTFIVIDDARFKTKSWKDGVRWFAFKRVQRDDLAIATGGMVPESIVRFLQRETERHIEAYFEDRKTFVSVIVELAKGTQIVIASFTEYQKQAGETLQEALQTLREQASGQSEMAVALAKIEASSKLREQGLDVFKDWMSSTKSEASDVAKIISNVANLLGDDDAATLRAHPAGAGLFAATNFTTLRNAGIAVRDAIASGAVKLSSEALARVMPYVKELIG